MQRDYIPINEHGMELVEHITEGFPCAIFFADIAKYVLGYAPWHWHEEIEVLYITKGSLRIFIGGNEYIVKENEGAFVNSNVLHFMEVAEGNCCELITVLFSPSIFCGGKNTPLYQKVTSSLLHHPEFATHIFTTTSPITGKFEKSMKHILMIYQQNPPHMELLIGEQLSKIWRFIQTDIIDSHHKKTFVHPLQEQRVQDMLQYIHANYASSLSIQNIATSADISTRECTRCFQNVLHTSPAKYLIEYRISTSLSLLRTTDYTITYIANMVGFGSSSYFTKVFVAHMGMSPTAYRKSHTP